METAVLIGIIALILVVLHNCGVDLSDFLSEVADNIDFD